MAVVCLSVRPSVCLSVCLSVGLSVRASVRASVRPSVCLSVCPFVPYLTLSREWKGVLKLNRLKTGRKEAHDAFDP